MKIYGVTNKRQLDIACPCCGSRSKLNDRSRKKRARREAKAEIRKEIEE